MTEEEMLDALKPDQEDEAKKISLINDELAGLGNPPGEAVIQALMRIVRKPTIPEASERVYDAAVEYLKGINRY